MQHIESHCFAPVLSDEEIFGATAPSPVTGQTIRRLAALEPRTLATMHGSSTQLRCAESLLELAAGFDAKLARL